MEKAQLQVNLACPAALGNGVVVYADAYRFQISPLPKIIFGEHIEGKIHCVAAVRLMPESNQGMNGLKATEAVFHQQFGIGNPGFESQPESTAQELPDVQAITANFVSVCAPVGHPEFTFGLYSLRMINEAAVAKHGTVNIHIPAALTVRTSSSIAIPLIQQILTAFNPAHNAKK